MNVKKRNLKKTNKNYVLSERRNYKMVNCTMCGSSIPDSQRVCSMCYGDIDYGSDGYYREWAERQEERCQEEDER